MTNHRIPGSAYINSPRGGLAAAALAEREVSAYIDEYALPAELTALTASNTKWMAGLSAFNRSHCSDAILFGCSRLTEQRLERIKANTTKRIEFEEAVAWIAEHIDSGSNAERYLRGL